MNSITLSQTAPISSLPRDYNALFRRSQVKNEPIVLLRHSKTVGALISEKLLKQFSKIQRMYEEEKLLRIAAEAREEYASGEMLNSNNSNLAELIGYED